MNINTYIIWFTVVIASIDENDLQIPLSSYNDDTAKYC